MIRLLVIMVFSYLSIYIQSVNILSVNTSLVHIHSFRTVPLVHCEINVRRTSILLEKSINLHAHTNSLFHHSMQGVKFGFKKSNLKCMFFDLKMIWTILKGSSSFYFCWRGCRRGYFKMKFNGNKDGGLFWERGQTLKKHEKGFTASMNTLKFFWIKPENFNFWT